MNSSEYTLRRANALDAEAILRVHHDAVRVLCSAHYHPEQIAAWIGQADNENWLDMRLARPGYIFLVAELYGTVAGFAERQGDEVFAVYVHPLHTRRGVATMMMRELERTAMAERLDILRVTASVTAEPFYRAVGFQVAGPGIHVFVDGTAIASVKMYKWLHRAGAVAGAGGL